MTNKSGLTNITFPIYSRLIIPSDGTAIESVLQFEEGILYFICGIELFIKNNTLILKMDFFH